MLSTILWFALFLVGFSATAATVDCSEVYGKSAQCERTACNEKYQSFIGTWSGQFQSYSQELSTATEAVFRPFENKVTYSEADCLKNISNGDTFIIGRRTDTYPAFQGLSPKTSKGVLVTGRKSDGRPFLNTSDEQGFNEYHLVYQNNVANLSIWELIVPASADGKSPEMRFSTIDGQDFLVDGIHKRNVTVTMSIGPKENSFWEGVVVKGSHTLHKRAECDYSAERIQEKDPKSANFLWTLPEHPDLWSPFGGNDKFVDAYRNWVMARTPWTWREILQNYIEVVRKGLGFVDPVSSLIAKGEAGAVRPMTCLESLPFRELLRAVAPKDDMPEFSTKVFRKDGVFKVLTHFRPAESGMNGARNSDELISLSNQLIAEGWRLYADLHNHPFDFSNSYGDVGGNLAPSNPDLASYHNLQPDLAIITNGIESIHLSREDQEKLFQISETDLRRQR